MWLCMDGLQMLPIWIWICMVHALSFECELCWCCSSAHCIGLITSGAPSPTLGKNVAMGYIASSHAKAGTSVKLQVRQRAVDSSTSKMPFVPAKYYTPGQKWWPAVCDWFLLDWIHVEEANMRPKRRTWLYAALHDDSWAECNEMVECRVRGSAPIIDFLSVGVQYYTVVLRGYCTPPF